MGSDNDSDCNNSECISKKRKVRTLYKEERRKLSKRDEERFYLKKLESENVASLTNDSSSSGCSLSSENDGETDCWSISKSPIDKFKNFRMSDGLKGFKNMGALVVSPVKLKRKSDLNKTKKLTENRMTNSSPLKLKLNALCKQIAGDKENLSEIDNSGLVSHTNVINEENMKHNTSPCSRNAQMKEDKWSSASVEKVDSNIVVTEHSKVVCTNISKQLSVVLEKLSPKTLKKIHQKSTNKSLENIDLSGVDEITGHRSRKIKMLKDDLAFPLESLEDNHLRSEQEQRGENVKNRRTSYKLRGATKAKPNYIDFSFEDSGSESSSEDSVYRSLQKMKLVKENKDNVRRTPIESGCKSKKNPKTEFHSPASSSVEKMGLRKRNENKQPCYREVDSDEKPNKRHSKVDSPRTQSLRDKDEQSSKCEDRSDKELVKTPRLSLRLQKRESAKKELNSKEKSEGESNRTRRLVVKNQNLSPLVDSVERISLRNRSEIKKVWGDEFEVDLGPRRQSVVKSPRTPSNSLRKQVLESSTTRSAKKKLVMGSDSSSSDSDEELTPLKRTPRKVAKTSDKTPVKTPNKSTPNKSTPSKSTPSKSTPSKSTPSKSTPSKSTPNKLVQRTPNKLTPSKFTPSKSTPGKNRGEPSTPCTPKTVRRVGHGFLTPVVEDRLIRRTSVSSMEEVRLKLHVSTVPSSLPCRLNEFNNILSFVSCKIKDKSSGCMYISGVPGTGKTATVHGVVKNLQQKAIDGKVSPFDFVEVNGLRLTEARQAYVRIWQSLSGNKSSADLALHSLEKKFSGRPSRPTVLLVDELDYVCNRRQDVIYNILDWSTKKNSRLVILTIANTMDLPERTLKGRVTSRMGLTRLVFQPYSYQQLQEIVMDRIQGSSSFDPDAVQYVARKVAAVSGDARRALDICRRATELLDKTEKQVSLEHVDKTLLQIFHSRRVQAIKHCSYMCQVLLRSIRDETLRTGVEETNLRDVFSHLSAICNLEGSWLPTVGQIISLCRTLTSSGLLSMEKGRHDILTKVTLNVSADDIHYALSC